MPSSREIKDSGKAGDEDDDENGEEREESDDEDERDEDRDADRGHEEQRNRRSAKSVKPSGRSRWQHFKAWYRDSRLYLYAAFFAGSFLLAVIGLLSIFARGALGTGLESWFNSIGSFNTYLFFGGFIFILAAGYLFLALLSKRAEFKRLVSTKSKADFVHSLDHIERLAFELGTHENDIVAARKREFKIRH